MRIDYNTQFPPNCLNKHSTLVTELFPLQLPVLSSPTSIADSIREFYTSSSDSSVFQVKTTSNTFISDNVQLICNTNFYGASIQNTGFNTYTSIVFSFAFPWFLISIAHISFTTILFITTKLTSFYFQSVKMICEARFILSLHMAKYRAVQICLFFVAVIQRF